MSEGVAGESKGITRRGAVKTAATFAAGAAVGAVASRAPELLRKEDNPLIDSLKEFTLDDFKDPGSEKFKRLFDASANEFVGLLQPEGVTAEDLKKRTRFFTNEADYKVAVERAGGVFVLADGEVRFGDYVRRKGDYYGQVLMNLDGLKRVAESGSEYPGVMIYRWLVHEWVHALGRNVVSGAYLDNKKEIITDRDGKNPEVWEGYQGGRIRTRNYTALTNFDEAWTDFITKGVVTESLKKDQKLLDSAITYLGNSNYLEVTNRFGRLAQRAGLDAKTLARLYQDSNIERLFPRIGSIFKETALSQVSAVQKGQRTETEVLQDKSFILGKRMAFIIDFKDWGLYNDMLTHLR